MRATEPMPASIGWHPWFVKPERVDLRFERMYLRDDEYIADGRPSRRRHRLRGTTASPGHWRRHGCGSATCEVSIDSDCDYWVVYDMPAHATCVEPQTATPDAFNLPGTRWRARLEPGDELRRTMTIAWSTRAT